jgi:hypothetical protein
MAVIVACVAGLGEGEARAQLDTRHWIQTHWASDTGTASLENHYLILTTPETSDVAFTVTDGAGVEVATGVV